MKHPLLALAAAAGFACTAGMLVAGPLAPPAGPISASYKTLGEIEPRIPINAQTCPGDNDATPSLYKITEPGSYYLTGAVTGVAGKIGIEIAASDVTVDLGGSVVRGVPGTLAGIRAAGAISGISIHDGTVSGWGQGGILLDSASACRIERVIVSSNNSSGLYAGTAAVVIACTAKDNNGVGLAAGPSSSFENCVSTGNSSEGFYASEGAAFRSCTSSSNGLTGIMLNGSGTFSGCASYDNQGSGFACGYGATYSDCTAKDNSLHGFWVNSGSSATGCTAYANGWHGFYVTGGSVLDSRSSFNGRDGISFDSGSSTATGNTCRGNGASQPGAGIRAAFSACRVDSNQVIENDIGIVAGADTIVVRNTARGNISGNYSFAAGSESGQIITNPGTGFVATNPWANFAY